MSSRRWHNSSGPITLNVKEEKGMFDFLRGKKTYLTAAIGFIATILYKLGYIPEEVYQWILTFDIPAFGMALRAGVENSKGF